MRIDMSLNTQPAGYSLLGFFFHFCGRIDDECELFLSAIVMVERFYLEHEFDLPVGNIFELRTQHPVPEADRLPPLQLADQVNV